MIQKVYHELSDERDIDNLRKSGLYSRLESLRRKGLWEVITFEEWLDSVADEFLPAILRGKGFSRLASVFALPHYPDSEKRVVELAVEKELALVLPQDCYTSAVSLGKTKNSFVQRYWSEALSLNDFLAKYELRPFTKSDYFVWQDENGFQYTQPEVIFRPEAITEFRKIMGHKQALSL